MNQMLHVIDTDESQQDNVEWKRQVADQYTHLYDVNTYKPIGYIVINRMQIHLHGIKQKSTQLQGSICLWGEEMGIHRWHRQPL